MPTAPTPIVNITEPVPVTSDPADFDSRADLAWTELPVAIDGVDAAALVTYNNALEVFNAATDLEATAAVAAAGTQLVAFSTSTLTVAAGTLAIHFTSPKTGFGPNDQVVVVLRSDTSIKMFGTVATFDGADDMTVTVIGSGVFGSGTFSSWVIMSAAFLAAGATSAQVLAGATDTVAVTPASLKGAKAFQTLTDAATIAWNGALGVNAQVTLTATRAVGAISNPFDGETYALFVTQGGAGNFSLTWNGIFDWGQAGPPSLSTAAGKTDQCFGIYSATTGKVHMNFRRSA